MATKTLDAKGLVCPLPVLRANKAIKELRGGDVLEVLVTDPGAPKDLEIFCENTGHQLLDSREEDGFFAITIRKQE